MGMARWRLAIALMVPEPVAGEVDGLRRALGDRQLDIIGPHVTLVPPTNVAEEDVADALAAVRTAAAVRRDLLTLELGPIRTFAPANRVLYLAVEPLAAVAAVRDALRLPPFDRPDRRPFVPHVTVDIDTGSDERVTAALAALAAYRATVPVPGVTLLRERRDEGGRRWVPIADAAFGEPVVVGRGGIEIELTTGTFVDPEAAALVPNGTSTAHDLVVTARRATTPVGVATADRAGPEHAGDSLALTCLVIAPDERGLGIGRTLLAELASRASAAGAAALVASGPVGIAVADFLVAHGWRSGSALTRRLV